MSRYLLALALALLADFSALAAPADNAQVRRALAGLAIPFEENAGQHDPQVAYAARIASGTAFVTRDGRLVHSLSGGGSAPGWTLVEAFPGAALDPRGATAHKAGVTYLRHGDDGPRHARTWGSVSLGAPWPGIEVSVVARGSEVEKLFTVAPGADASRIRVTVGGARALRVDGDGALVAETDDRPLRFTAPVAWQEIAGERRSVQVAYSVRGHEYGFRLGAHDPNVAVVIDPILQTISFGGTSFSIAYAIAREPSGTVLVAGSTSSGPFPGIAGGAVPTFVGGLQNGFVTKLSADLATIIQSTYFGGPVSSARALAIDAAGNVFVAGWEPLSPSGFSEFYPPLPGTVGAAQPSPGGGSADAFVAKLSGDLRTLVRATYLGGSASDLANALSIDAAGNVVVAGETLSPDFPGVAGGAQAIHGGGRDAFVARLSNDLTTLVRATYVGGALDDSATAMALDATGSLYVTGFTASSNLPGVAGAAQAAHAGGGIDAFVARLGPDLSTLVRSTYLGGGASDSGVSIAVAPAGGGVYVTGGTESTNFPATAGGVQAASNGFQDPFVARLSADLGSLVQATYLGSGGGNEQGTAIVVDGSTVVVAGTTPATTLPGITGGAQPFNDSGRGGFVARLAGDLKSVVQSTFVSPGSLGTATNVNAMVVEPAGNVLVAGGLGAQVFVARITGDLRALPPVAFHVSVAPAVARGGTLRVTVSARDASNQTVLGYSGAMQLTTTDGAAVIVPLAGTPFRGVGLFDVTFNTVGSQTLTAADTVDTALTGNGQTTVANVANIVVAPPSSATAGAFFNATVTAYDAVGTILPGALLRFTSSAASSAMPSDVTTAATPVTRSFRIMTAGDQTLTATDLRAPGVAGTSSTITIVPGTVQRFAVSAPAQAAAGVGFSATVEARDAFDNFSPGYSGTVRITSTDSAASLPPDAALSNSRGTFAVTLNTAGTHTIVATAVGQPGVTGSALVEVTPAVRFTIATPASATAGTAFNATVTARSPEGAALTGYAGTIRFSATDAAAALPANATLSGGTGVFSVVLKTAGQQTITVTDVTNPAYVGTSPVVSVGPAAAAALAVSAPPLALPGVAFDIVVTARDAFGNLAPGNVSTVRLASSDAAAVLPADAPLANGTRSFSVILNTNGTQTMTASDVATALTPATSAGISVSSLGVSPVSIDFGGQSMGTTSPPVDVTVLTANPTTLSFALTGTQFSAQANACAVAAPNAPCTVRVIFAPPVAAGPLNSTAPAVGTLTVTSPTAGSRDVALSGVGEKSLVSHYYRSILRRAPDAGGRVFWSDEAARVSGLGANVNEVWFAMAMEFYSSPEYAASSGNNTAFVTDLYNTFFNRTPDAGGLGYWVGQLDQGMPRGVALAEFMFSAEFRNFTQAIFGNTAVRAEVNAVMDFYRGLLGRLPDSAGFNAWVGRFRTAQCQGSATVSSEVGAISSEFALSQEYAARARDSSQYVGDLYNAFLRRGGDLQGVQFWINEVASGARTREQVRVQFRNSFEFSARVNAISAQGCLP